MATGKRKRNARSRSSKPRFPYTTAPKLLRKFLQEVPKRPKPPRLDFSLIQTWGMRDSNARTIIRVAKDLGLIDGSGVPTQHYGDFMKDGTGPTALAARINDVYSELFAASTEPYRDSNESLKNFFNIHSGGSERVIQLQVQTFMALCEYADFSTVAPSAGLTPASAPRTPAPATSGQANPQIQISLHIHLPETKSRSEYEDIIKDIAKYIYGK
jgi:hypothetical protein